MKENKLEVTMKKYAGFDFNHYAGMSSSDRKICLSDKLMASMCRMRKVQLKELGWRPLKTREEFRRLLRSGRRIACFNHQCGCIGQVTKVTRCLDSDGDIEIGHLKHQSAMGWIISSCNVFAGVDLAVDLNSIWVKSK